MKTRLEAVGGRKTVFSVLTYRTLFFVVVIIELFQKGVFQCYCPEGLLQAEAMEHFAGDNDHENHMVVAMALAASTVLCLAILTNNEECYFSRSTTFLGQTYTCVMIMCIYTTCQI